MKIIVCIKQVPDAKDITWTSDNTMKREGVESVINNCDLYALESALDLKKQNPDTQIIVLSMGPKQAENIIREAIALGADEGFLICDKKCSGSDTLATGLVLSSAIKKIAPDYKLILCGQFASDGDTAQTGVQIASNLDCNQITYCKNIVEVSENYIIALQEDETYEQTVKSLLPCVICITENSERTLSDALIEGQIKAQDAKITTLSIDDIGLCDSQTGIKGSPTYVSKVFRPEHKRKCEVLEQESAVNKVKNLLNEVCDR